MIERTQQAGSRGHRKWSPRPSGIWHCLASNLLPTFHRGLETSGENYTALQRHIPEEQENPSAQLRKPKNSQRNKTSSNPSGEANYFDWNFCRFLQPPSAIQEGAKHKSSVIPSTSFPIHC